MVRVDSIKFSRTFAGAYCGTYKILSAVLRENLEKEYSKKGMLLLDKFPEKNLPEWKCVVEFDGSPIDPEMHGSSLTVCTFVDSLEFLPLEFASGLLEEVDWNAHALDYEI